MLTRNGGPTNTNVLCGACLQTHIEERPIRLCVCSRCGVEEPEQVPGRHTAPAGWIHITASTEPTWQLDGPTNMHGPSGRRVSRSYCRACAAAVWAQLGFMLGDKFFDPMFDGEG